MIGFLLLNIILNKHLVCLFVCKLDFLLASFDMLSVKRTCFPCGFVTRKNAKLIKRPIQRPDLLLGRAARKADRIDEGESEKKDESKKKRENTKNEITS